jgi:LacI family transcriptional regulator
VAKINRVVISFNMSGIAGRAMLRGASSYAKANRNWTCKICPPHAGIYDQVVDWEPEGILLESWDTPWAERFRAAGIWTVEVGPGVTRQNAAKGYPSVGVDNPAIGEMVARYFIDRGHRNFASIGLERRHAELEREAGYRRVIEAAGFTCDGRYLSDFAENIAERVDVERALGQWLSKLAKPTAVFAHNDGRGLQTLEVAHQNQLNAPDDFAIVGVDDDDVLCEAINPPLSSVVLPWEQVGHEAANLLAMLMRGGKKTEAQIYLPPVRVNTRHSSDILAIHDDDLAAAVRFIRQRAGSPIQVEDVIEQVNMSRRSLERRFKALLGHTLLDEIHTAHLEAAKQLLIHTDLPMPKVASRSGFADERRLWSAFKSSTKMNPSDFRRQFRLR